MGVELALVGLALSAVSTVVQIDAASDAASAQRESAAIQTATQESQNRISRRQQIRKERVRRAQIEQASQNIGAAGSSSEAGALASGQGNLAFNTAFTRGQTLAARGIGRQNERISEAQTTSQIAGLAGQVGSFAFQAGGGLGAIKTIFSTGS